MLSLGFSHVWAQLYTCSQHNYLGGFYSLVILRILQRPGHSLPKQARSVTLGPKAHNVNTALLGWHPISLSKAFQKETFGIDCSSLLRNHPKPHIKSLFEVEVVFSRYLYPQWHRLAMVDCWSQANWLSGIVVDCPMCYMHRLHDIILL